MARKSIPCAFSCTPEFLAAVDERAKSLGMSRSQYVVQVLRADLHERTSTLSIVTEPKVEYGKPTTNHRGKHITKEKS